MLDLKKSFGSDEKVETDGVWEEIQDGARVLVARVRNKNWRREARRLPRSIRRQMQDDVLPEGVMDEITAELMAKTVFLDFDGLAIENVTLENTDWKFRKQLLIDFPDFRERVFEIANDAAIFRDREVKDLGKGAATQ